MAIQTEMPMAIRTSAMTIVIEAASMKNSSSAKLTSSCGLTPKLASI